MTSPMKNVIGLGYEGRDVVEVVTTVKAAGAHTLIDVRLSPISRKPGLSKTKLGQALANAGVDYLHLRELGNPRENRAGFWSTTALERDAAHAYFRDHVLSQEAAQSSLQRIKELAERGPVMLLCFEADESCCHRSLVIEALAQQVVMA